MVFYSLSSMKGALLVGLTLSGVVLLSQWTSSSESKSINTSFFGLPFVKAGAPVCPASLNCKGLPHEEYIVEKVTTKPCVVFSKSYCPYCKRAKSILASAKAPCEVIELDQHESGMAIQSALASMTGRRTVPNIFMKGEPVGGADTIMGLEASGQLSDLVKDLK